MFFFAVLSGGTPGESRKNESKTPDALDVGPDGGMVGGSPEAVRSTAGFHNFGSKDFSAAGTQISELGVCCRPKGDRRYLRE
jgi:hypothetical protein